MDDGGEYIVFVAALLLGLALRGVGLAKGAMWLWLRSGEALRCRTE